MQVVNQRNFIFRECNGLWLRVDSREPNPPTLAEILKELEIVIDDDIQFCKIIRYIEKYKKVITIRHYNNSKITINVNYYAE